MDHNYGNEIGRGIAEKARQQELSLLSILQIMLYENTNKDQYNFIIAPSSNFKVRCNFTVECD